MSPVMNWRKETSSNNPIYPEGTYKVRIASFERVTAKTGTKQLRWRATIVLPEEHAGRSFVEHTPLTDKSLWKVAGLISACGIDTTKLENMGTDTALFDKVCHTCVGRTAMWRNAAGVSQDGNPRNNIVEYRPDPKQSVEVFSGDSDAPSFVKGETWDGKEGK
jgi:hypothetical protein